MPETIAELLELTGSRVRGPNRADCPKCARFRAISFTEETFHCFKCGWKGNTVTLAKELGIYRRLSRSEWQELDRRRQQCRQAAQAVVEERAFRARCCAENILGRSKPVDFHAYLVRKGIKPHGIFASCGELVIPARDADGVLHNVQRITADGEKRFLTGGRVSGCCYPLGSLNGRVWLVEGFATGATIYEATGDAVLVCFFASNLEHVAEALRWNRPEAEMLVAADNDAKTPGNPGKAAAIRVAKRFGIRAIWPTFPEGSDGTDFNDLAQEIGLDGVWQEIDRAAGSQRQERNTA